MMKYISILFFLILMIWTWSIVHKESSVPFETHAGIQNKLIDIIAETIHKKKPDATDIFIEKVWTELIAENQVKAHFSYRFKAPITDGTMTTSEISGEGTLDHQTDDGSGFDRWRLSNIKTTSDAIKFEDAMVITTGILLPLPTKYLVIDEEGFPLFNELRIQDPQVGKEILMNIEFAENGAMQTSLHDEKYLVEAFDEPYVAQFITEKDNKYFIELPYMLEIEFDPKTLTVDEWDRFHGLTKGQIPFVFSRKAQADFFDKLEEFDDESITINKKKIAIKPHLTTEQEVHTEKYWSHIYQTETPGWEMNQATPVLIDMLPRMKIPPSRIIVLGCGSGNDAAYFAQHGHFVTAVDISPEAISRAKEKYGDVHNLKFVQADVFKLPQDFDNSFDVVFEHTCYCAINPEKRNDLVKIWRRLLQPEGHLMAVLFAMEKKGSPPFGGSEWEIRERLKKGFQFLFWTRWRQSVERRSGKELFVYALKRKL